MNISNENQNDQIHLIRKEQIKKAALKVFAHHGIVRAKMNMIATEAGISQGLTYRYFNSKEELFTILVKEALVESESAIDNISQLPGTPMERIKTLTKRMLEEDHKYSFLLIQHAQTSADVPTEVKKVFDYYSVEKTIDKLIPLFKEGQQLGEFCVGDPQKMLFLYFSVITGLMLQDIQTSESFWLKEVDTLIKIIK
ncbi:TetR/AcrR family transcriptional regulator [Heyndrickxia sporothermodurans]